MQPSSNNTQNNDIQNNDTQYTDIEYNDTQYNDIEYNDTQHIDIEYNNTLLEGSFATLSIGDIQHYSTLSLWHV